MIRDDCIALANVWKNIVLTYQPDLYLYEIQKFDNINDTPDVLNSIFNYMGGYFLDVFEYRNDLSINEELDFNFVEEYSKKFGYGSKNKKMIKYTQESTGEDKKIVCNLITLDENGNAINTEDIGVIEQTATRILSSLLIPPIIASKNNSNLIGIMFDDSSIDVKNLPLLIEYYNALFKKDILKDSKLILIVTAENVGRNNYYYCDHVKRVGVIKHNEFYPVNSYTSCKTTIPSYYDVLKSKPFILFLGAGTSVDATSPKGDHMPLGYELKKIAIKNVVKNADLDGLSMPQLEDKFRDWLRDRGSYFSEERKNDYKVDVTLERVLHEEFAVRAPDYSKTLDYLDELSNDCIVPPSYVNINKIISAGLKPIIITTNYDKLLENAINNAFPICSRDQFLLAEEHIGSYLSNESQNVPILKIHGSLHDRYSIRDSVNKIFELHDSVKDTLDSIYFDDLNMRFFNSGSVYTFFAGYSFSDEDISEYFDDSELNTKCKAFCVNPSPVSKFENIFCNEAINDFYVNSMITIPFNIFMSILNELSSD